MIGAIIGLVIGFIAGVLVGRANPKKADKLAGLATDLQGKVSDQFKKG